MRRIIAVMLILLMVLPFSLVAFAETYIPSRTINLVYDDSGSMIRTGTDTGTQYVDTWCQAKYAMEVFAGMLGERETLNIYYMSDYVDGSTTAPPKLSLNGSKDAAVTAANVKKSTILLRMRRILRSILSKKLTRTSRRLIPMSAGWLFLLTVSSTTQAMKELQATLTNVLPTAKQEL